MKDKKLKKRNMWTALGLIIFMVFIYFYTLQCWSF